MDKHRDTRSYDRRDQDPRGRRGGATRRKRKKHGRAFKVVMTIVLIFVITLAMLLCMSAAYIKNVIIPDASLDMSDFNPNLTSKVLAQNPETGSYETVQTLYGEENRVWVSTDEIPQYLKDAAVAIEDKRFYKHNGVDWVRTAKAISLMFTGRSIQGGSTLTQQLIKNMTSDDEVTVKRKVMEIFRALEFEKKYTKDDILEAYLNYIYLGQGCNGVYTAAYTYFGKHVSELDLAECACLIGITNNPSKYDPLGHLSITDPDTGGFTFDNYKYFFETPRELTNILFTLGIVFLTVALAIVLAYLLALYLRFVKSKVSRLIGNLYLLPRFVPSMVAVYAMITVVRDSGLLNRISQLFGGDFKPGMMYHASGLVTMNMWFNIPFAALMITAGLGAIPDSMIESARDVGASKLRVLRSMILPLSMKDVVIAATFVFMSNVGSFTTPYLMGGNYPKMLGIVLFDQFNKYLRYERAAAMSFIIFLICSVSAGVYIYTNLREKEWEK